MHNNAANYEQFGLFTILKFKFNNFEMRHRKTMRKTKKTQQTVKRRTNKRRKNQLYLRAVAIFFLLFVL